MSGRADFDAIVVGAGAAGLAAAWAIACGGRHRVLVLERDARPGGVLRQCVHDGFGLHVHGESLTGPEYAGRWVARAVGAGVRVACSTTVLSLRSTGKGFEVDALGEPVGGRALLRCRALVCATGCRERTRGSLLVPGGRPAGVYTAGQAQYMVNVANQMPGTKVAVLGSGDIGLIMARRMTLEGAEVRLVLGQEATGLLRNHISCIQDFGIPIRYGWGLASVHGFGQLQGITVAPMGADGALDLSRKEYVRVNALLLAVGLVSEREVLAGVAAGTPGLFTCGNAARPHDLVDQVTCEAASTGLAVRSYLEGAGAAAHGVPGELRRLASLQVSEPKGRLADIAGGAGRHIACTACPTGCIMAVGTDGAVTGNKCPRGRAFADEEAACPKRVFTGTVALPRGGLLPVRTARPVPRDALRDVARACMRPPRGWQVAGARMGDAVCVDVAGTGAPLVACADAADIEAAADAAGTSGHGGMTEREDLT